VDGKHDAATELVVDFPLALAEQATALHQLQRLVPRSQVFLQRVPAVGGIANPEIPANFPGQTARSQIIDGRLMVSQLRLEERSC
jgi:hypothetical protein